MKRDIVCVCLIFCLFLGGCGKRFNQITDLLGKYIGPGYHERMARENAKTSAPAEQDDDYKDQAEKEIEIAKDVNIVPWAAKDGVIPKEIIGELKVRKAAMEIHQYGGRASVIVRLTEEGDQYLVSQIYMDSSGDKWYCIGQNMWLLVGDMDDIQYSVVKRNKET